MIAVLLSCLGVSVFASSNDSPDPIQFFYSAECSSCQKMNAFLDDFTTSYPAIPIVSYEINEYAEEWNHACTQAGIPVWGVPRIFIGDSIFAGWYEEDGELFYVPEYYGYLGYKNQILLAMENYLNQDLTIEASTVPENGSSDVDAATAGLCVGGC